MPTDPSTPILLFAVFAVVGLIHALISSSRRVAVAWFIVCMVMLIASVVIIFGGK